MDFHIDKLLAEVRAEWERDQQITQTQVIDLEPTVVEQPEWEGEPVKAERVIVLVANHESIGSQDHWAYPFAGTLREAVRIETEWDVFYIDNEGFPNPAYGYAVYLQAAALRQRNFGHHDHGWEKLMSRGLRKTPHAIVPVDREVRVGQSRGL